MAWLRWSRRSPERSWSPCRAWTSCPLGFPGAKEPRGLSRCGAETWRPCRFQTWHVTRLLMSSAMSLGLSHNADPRTLMCGRPAPCRPDSFASTTVRLFPLTLSDERQLRERWP